MAGTSCCIPFYRGHIVVLRKALLRMAAIQEDGIFLSSGQWPNAAPHQSGTMIDVTLSTRHLCLPPSPTFVTYLPLPQVRTTRCVKCQTLEWIMATKKGLRLVTIKEVRSLFPNHASNPD